jgi:hypothetical protein
LHENENKKTTFHKAIDGRLSIIEEEKKILPGKTV